MPYEGVAAAVWTLFDDSGEPQLRSAPYDIPALVAELVATGAPDVEELMLRESLYDFADPATVATRVEPQP